MVRAAFDKTRSISKVLSSLYYKCFTEHDTYCFFLIRTNHIHP